MISWLNLVKNVYTVTKKEITLKKVFWSEIEKFLRKCKILEVRYLSDAINAAAASQAKNTIKVRC